MGEPSTQKVCTSVVAETPLGQLRLLAVIPAAKAVAPAASTDGKPAARLCPEWLV